MKLLDAHICISTNLIPNLYLNILKHELYVISMCCLNIVFLLTPQSSFKKIKPIQLLKYQRSYRFSYTIFVLYPYKLEFSIAYQLGRFRVSVSLLPVSILPGKPHHHVQQRTGKPVVCEEALQRFYPHFLHSLRKKQSFPEGL